LPLLAAAGCALLAPSVPPEGEPEPLPSAAPVVPPVPSEAPRAAPVAAMPAPRALPATPAPVARPVAIVHDGTVASHADVAAAIAARLSSAHFAPRMIGLDGVQSADAAAVVAVGREAAFAARARFPDRPIVFCQVFDYHELLAAGGVWGVHAMPPVALQLRAWKTVVPSLERVGFILSAAHADLAEEALQAAASAGIRVSHEISSSDRETLYLFRRLAADIDGLWLFPDNRILSRTVLRELLAYASARDISVLVHSDALLEWGASFSVASTPADVARSVHRVLDAIVDGAAPAAMTRLSEVALTSNPAAAGSAAVPPARWVLRELD